MEVKRCEFGESGTKMGALDGVSRAEIDTSAPFESVKEAVTRFGGIGYWKPSQHKFIPGTENGIEEVDIAKLEEQTAQLEKDLIVKERETLDVLKELEATKETVKELKSKLLQQQASEVNVTLEMNTDVNNVTSAAKEAEKENHQGGHPYLAGCLSPRPSSAPGLILMELKQAKLNLCRTTNDLTDIQGSVESLNKKLEKERISLEKTRQRISQNSSKISSLEEELNQTWLKLQVAKYAETKSSADDPLDMSKELQRLSSKAEQFKKVGEAARCEVSRAISEIEQTRTRIKTTEMRLLAAKKMKEAARAAEAVALEEIKTLSCRESSSEAVTVSFEEYSSLMCKAQNAKELSSRRVVDAMLQVDEANVSKMEVLKRVEEATEEVKTSKKALEEALKRVEAANKGKLAVEEALRKWRSEHGQKRRSVHNSTKFKNSHPSHIRKDSRLLDVNGMNLVSDDPTPVLKPTLSIGQILSQKLLQPKDFETKMLAEKGTAKRKVSLGQMLRKPSVDFASSQKTERESGHKQFSGKRKKFGFARFSLLLATQSKKKKKPTLNLR